MTALLTLDRLGVTLADNRPGSSSARLLDDVGLSLNAGESLAVVGESGSGKTSLALAIMRLLPPGTRIDGVVALDGENLLPLSERAMAGLRGRRMAMVFQEPLRALDPIQPVGLQIAAPLRRHLGLSRAAAEARCRTLLDRVGLHIDPARFPHQLSGGQRQRVLIAMALACDPALLIADEASTALDAATQRQILALLAELRAERGMALLLISHDLGLVSEFANRTAVLYGGRLIEAGATARIHDRPAHPYTAALLACSLHGRDIAPGSRLPVIPGMPPDPAALPPGCRFAPRCTRRQPPCDVAPPPLLPQPGGQDAACLYPLS